MEKYPTKCGIWGSGIRKKRNVCAIHVQWVKFFWLCQVVIFTTVKMLPRVLIVCYIVWPCYFLFIKFLSCDRPLDGCNSELKNARQRSVLARKQRMDQVWYGMKSLEVSSDLRNKGASWSLLKLLGNRLSSLGFDFKF